MILQFGGEYVGHKGQQKEGMVVVIDDHHRCKSSLWGDYSKIGKVLERGVGGYREWAQKGKGW